MADNDFVGFINCFSSSILFSPTFLANNILTKKPSKNILFSKFPVRFVVIICGNDSFDFPISPISPSSSSPSRKYLTRSVWVRRKHLLAARDHQGLWAGLPRSGRRIDRILSSVWNLQCAPCNPFSSALCPRCPSVVTTI